MASERHLSQRANTFQMGDMSHHQQHAMRNGMSMERKMDAPVSSSNLYCPYSSSCNFPISVCGHAQGIARSLRRGADSLRDGADPVGGAGAHRTIPGKVLGPLIRMSCNLSPSNTRVSFVCSLFNPFRPRLCPAHHPNFHPFSIQLCVVKCN